MKTNLLTAGALVFLGLASLSSTWAISPADAQSRSGRYGRNYRNTVQVLVPAGTAINVRLDSKISTEHASQGDPWTGTVTQAVVRSGRIVIPQGSAVEGWVTGTAQGTHNTPAQLNLAVRQATVDGQYHGLNADAQPIVAGTRRAKKLGAVVGGAAVGALLGSVVGGKKSAVIGGVVGGAAGYGLTRSGLRTLVLKPGTVVSFTTREDVLARR